MQRIAAHSSVALVLACLMLAIAAPADAHRLLAEDTTNGILPAGTDAFYTAMAELRQSGYTPNTFTATTPALAPTAAKSAAAAPTALTEERSAPLHASAPAAFMPQSAAPAAGMALSPSAVAAPAPGPIPGLSAAQNQQLAQLRAQDPIAADLQTQVYKSRAADASAGVTPQSVLAALKPIHDQVQAMVLSEADNPDPFQREHMQLDLIKSAVPAAALVQQAAQPITTVVEKAQEKSAAEVQRATQFNRAQAAGAPAQPAAAQPSWWPFG